MKSLTFSKSGVLRRVFIDSRKVTFILPELNNIPLSFDLDKINLLAIKDKIGSDAVKLLEDLQKLKSEEDIMRDVVTDFNKEGWLIHVSY